MVHFPPDPSDDLQFIDLAERVINGEAALVSATHLHLIRIDSWFGPNWYSFAGKMLGALGIHSEKRLRIPPFHPHRVVSEARFKLDEPPVPVAFRPFHCVRSSESNDRNMFNRFGHPGVTVTAGWYSGGSASSGRGSIMVYSTARYGAVGWYAGLERRNTWDVVKLLGIERRHWSTLLEGLSAAR